MRRRQILVALLVAVTAGCGSGQSDTTASAELFLPPGGTTGTLLVLVPGGGWRTADPAGLAPVARKLAQAGYAAATITYRASSVGAYFPVPAEDVLCAAASAVAQAKAAGQGSLRVVLVGHSAGGQLAVLTALRPAAFRSGCTDPAVNPAGVVALAGAFDLTGIGESLFGMPERDRPDLWHQGDVFSWVRERPQLPVLLVHGRADQLVPISSTERLATGLAAAGHPVQTRLLPAVTHDDIYRPEALVPVLLPWLSANGFGDGVKALRPL